MARNTIKLKDYLHVVGEHEASGAITPGMFVGVTSTGKVAVVATAANGVMVANEDEFQGKTIADAYAIGDMVQCWIPQRGDVVYGVLADGQDIEIGGALTIGAGGKLVTAGANAVVAIAVEAVDLSGTGVTEDGRIMARIV